MTAPTFTLPKSKPAYAMLPPEMRALVDGTVEAVKDKPWAAAPPVSLSFAIGAPYHDVGNFSR